MTYDERRELDTWFDIVKRNCERTLRSIDLMQDVLGKMKCSASERGTSDEEPAFEKQETNFTKQTDISLEE